MRFVIVIWNFKMAITASQQFYKHILVLIVQTAEWCYRDFYFQLYIGFHWSCVYFADATKKNALIAPVCDSSLAEVLEGGKKQTPKGLISVPPLVQCTRTGDIRSLVCPTKFHFSFLEAERLPLSNCHCTDKYLLMIQKTPLFWC